MFDPCLGTGTTIDAAIQLYRSGHGCEIDIECCEAINTRLWNTVEQLLQSNYSKLNISEQTEKLNIEENEDTGDEDDDGFPTINHPSYVNDLKRNKCSDDQILRFESEILFNLKIKPS